MKKWATILVSIMMIFAVAACSDNKDTVKELGEVSEDMQNKNNLSEDNNAETDRSDVFEAVDSYTWDGKDFELYGIMDMSPLNIGEFHYEKSENGTITVLWEKDFNYDFELITQDARALYEKTLAAGGKNGPIVFDEVALKWVIDTPYESFEEACYYWDEAGYLAMWYYEYNGMIIQVAYEGMNSEESVYSSFKFYPYQ